MKKFLISLSFILLCGICSGQEQKPSFWDADIQALKSYKAGSNAAKIIRLESALYDTDLNEDVKRELRKNLVGIFPKSTPEGQSMLFRLLFPSLDEETAKPLIPLLFDTTAAPETAKITLMILQDVPGKIIDAALLDALVKTEGDLKFGLIAAMGKRKMNSAVVPLAAIVRKQTNSPLAVAALHALSQIASDKALRQLESLQKEGLLSHSSKDAMIRAMETKNSNTRTGMLTSPYNPDVWPGQAADPVERVDVDKIIAKVQHDWLLEKDPVKKIERTKLYAIKASLLPKPSTAFIDLLQKANQLNDQKAILAAMGEKCCTDDVISLATQIMKANPALKASAGLALVRMANTLRRTNSETAKSILVVVQRDVQNEDIAKRATKVLETINRNEGCIRNWFYAGPFIHEGKSGHDLFRQVFPAEADRPEIQWQALIAGWQKGNCWNLEVGVEPVQNAAACLKTFVWSDVDQELTFQAANSGGIAAWCNKQQILNQWYDGPFEQWTFSAPIVLKKGYNTLIVKTVCSDKGWNFSARLRTKDNQKPNNIRIVSHRKDALPKVLLFTGSQTWIHSPTASGPHGNSCAELILKEVCRELGFELVWTDSGEIFNRPLDDFAAFVFYTCGEFNEKGRNGVTPVNNEGMAAFLKAIRERGTGFVAIHSASDSMHKWPEYIKLVGAEFVVHGMQQEAGVRHIGAALPQTEKITGKSFRHFEEWYTFRNFNPDIHVLMMQDTTGMIAEGNNTCYKQPPYPCTWIRAEGKGIVAFTSLGHSCEYWRTPEYHALLSELLAITTRKQKTDLTPNYQSLMKTK